MSSAQLTAYFKCSSGEAGGSGRFRREGTYIYTPMAHPGDGVAVPTYHVPMAAVLERHGEDRPGRWMWQLQEEGGGALLF